MRAILTTLCLLPLTAFAEDLPKRPSPMPQTTDGVPHVQIDVRAVPELREQAKELWQEAKELHLIFAKIYRSKQ